MDVCRSVLNFSLINKLFDTELLVVGVSGGPDSVALLSVLCELRDSGDLKCRLAAVHVNHMIRKGDCDEDEKFVLDFCKKCSVPCYVYREDITGLSVSEGCSLEKAGRDFRYSCFDDCCRKILGEDFEEKSRIAVAHHKNDLAETFMMNLYRGSGLDGLVAPLPLNGRTVRPFLTLSRSDILSYLEERGISYREDYTNYETDCTRNKWRNLIFPLISEVSVKPYENAVFETVDILRKDAEYLNLQADRFYDENVKTGRNCLFIKYDVLLKESFSISSRCLRKMWENVFGDKIDFAAGNVDDCLKFSASRGDAFRTIDMPKGRIFWTASGFCGFCEPGDILRVQAAVAEEMGFVVILFENSPESISLTFDNDGKTTKFTQMGIQIQTGIVENNSAVMYNSYSWFFPEEKELHEFSAACVSGEMKFQRAGSVCGKALKDVLADLKVPRDVRNKVLVVLMDGEPVFVPGLGHTKGFVSEKSRIRFEEHNGRSGKLLKVEIMEEEK